MGLFSSLKKYDADVSNLRIQAVQKADTNTNGILEPNECFEAYRVAGSSLRDIMRWKISDDAKYDGMRSLLNSPRGIDLISEYLEYAKQRGAKPTPEFLAKSVAGLTIALCDEDGSGKLSIDEVERFYMLAYRNVPVERLELDHIRKSNLKEYLLEMGKMFVMPFEPEDFIKGSELERYVNEGE